METQQQKGKTVWWEYVTLSGYKSNKLTMNKASRIRITLGRARMCGESLIWYLRSVNFDTDSVPVDRWVLCSIVCLRFFHFYFLLLILFVCFTFTFFSLLVWADFESCSHLLVQFFFLFFTRSRFHSHISPSCLFWSFFRLFVHRKEALIRPPEDVLRAVCNIYSQSFWRTDETLGSDSDWYHFFSSLLEHGILCSKANRQTNKQTWERGKNSKNERLSD